MRIFKIGFLAACVSFLLAFAATEISSAENMPADKAGIISSPTGKIAFIRDKNVWVMDLEKHAQGKSDAMFMVCEATNADGRLTWSPDNSRIMFTRSGVLDLKGPDLMGGRHKVYDIFTAFLDSAYSNNKLWWRRVTESLGSRDPEWSNDGKSIVYWRDMNANYADAEFPNYQVCFMKPDGSSIEMMRKDWQVTPGDYMIAPSLSTKGQLAFTFFYDQKPQGIVVLKPEEFMLPYDSLRERSKKTLRKIAPTWSPDSKWIAYIFNDIENPGVYISTPDFKENYLVFVPPVGTNLYTVGPSFSPDSKWLTYSTSDGSIWISDITGKGARRLSGPGLDSYPAWSRGESSSSTSSDE